MTIFHISGSSGSGKTTLGNKLYKRNLKNIVVYDVDDLHLNPQTRPKYWSELSKTKTILEAKKIWKKLIHKTIQDIIKENKGINIIFVGLIQQSLGNKYSPNNYEIKNADYKFFIDVPISKLIERYYTRLCYYEKKGTKKQNEIYWKNVGLNKQYILGSNDIITINNKNIIYAKKNNYKILSSDKIYKEISKVMV